MKRPRRPSAATPTRSRAWWWNRFQCEGGDRHLRAQFPQSLQDLCHRHDARFALDEVQTGCGTTGRPWAYQALGLVPDLVAFGKKTQVCGVMGGRKVLEVADNAFRSMSRISSTWGGNLVDMVRATRILRVIEDEDLVANAAEMGAFLLDGLRDCAARYPAMLSAPRGRGLICAVDVADGIVRDRVLKVARERHRALFLGCGDRTPPAAAPVGDPRRARRGPPQTAGHPGRGNGRGGRQRHRTGARPSHVRPEPSCLTAEPTAIR